MKFADQTDSEDSFGYPLILCIEEAGRSFPFYIFWGEISLHEVCVILSADISMPALVQVEFKTERSENSGRGIRYL